MSDSKRLISVDIGTSKIRACAFDEGMRLKWSEEQEVKLEYREDGDVLLVEMNPETLWHQFHTLVSQALEYVGDRSTVASVGICTQRNTFISWNTETLEPCHPLIVWKDCRSKDACSSWNKSLTMRCLHAVGRVAFFFTRSQRFKAACMYRFLGAMVTHRLLVTLEKSSEMQQLLERKKLAFGCIETWLLLRLTNGAVHQTEPSCASATGLFDPFTESWGYAILRLIGFPTSVLPTVVDTVTPGKPMIVADESHFGTPLPIGAVVGDQQSAVFGAGCVSSGSVKISLGTGTFVDLNTGAVPHASMHGLYPLIAWRVRGESTFIAEGKSDDTATLLAWALSIGLCENVAESADIAFSIDSAPNLHFVPAFGGLQTPINDEHACSAFFGIRPETTKAQMVRAILEAIAFRVWQIWGALEEEIGNIGDTVRLCGGVAQNDFVCQTIATLIDRKIDRLADGTFTAARGAALLAGVSAGLWSVSSSASLVSVERTFAPAASHRSQLLEQFESWKDAVQRCLRFYA